MVDDIGQTGPADIPNPSNHLKKSFRIARQRHRNLEIDTPRCVGSNCGPKRSAGDARGIFEDPDPGVLVGRELIDLHLDERSHQAIAGAEGDAHVGLGRSHAGQADATMRRPNPTRKEPIAPTRSTLRCQGWSPISPPLARVVSSWASHVPTAREKPKISKENPVNPKPGALRAIWASKPPIAVSTATAAVSAVIDPVANDATAVQGKP